MVNVQKAAALGSITAGTIVSDNGAALEVEGGITVTGESLSLFGNGIGGSGPY